MLQSALRDRDLLQPGSRLLVLSRVDRTFGITLPQGLQRLVAPRAHLAWEKTAHHPDHQQNNGHPEEDHHAHADEPPTTIHSKAVHHVRILLFCYGPCGPLCSLVVTPGSRCI